LLHQEFIPFYININITIVDFNPNPSTLTVIK